MVFDYSIAIHGNGSINKENNIIFSCITWIQIKEDDKYLTKITSKQLVDYVNLNTCQPKTIVNIKNKIYNIKLTGLKLENNNLILSYSDNLPSCLFKNGSVDILPCIYKSNVYGTLSLGGYNEQTFGCEERKAFKKSLSLLTNNSVCNILITKLEETKTLDISFIIITTSEKSAKKTSNQISNYIINGCLEKKMKECGLSKLLSVNIESIIPIPKILSGTFIFSLPTSLWNNELPIINKNKSFRKLKVSTKTIKNNTRVSVYFEYDTTITVKPINSDGLFLSNKNYIKNNNFIIEHYGFIPLSRGTPVEGNIFGNQFTSFNGKVLAKDAPAILEFTGLVNCFTNVLIKSADFGNLLKWNISNVTNLQSIFYAASNFNQPIYNWDVSNVTDMSGMFFNASLFNQPLNNWNVSNVTNMNGMFGNCVVFNQPINNWDVSNVTNMKAMFDNCVVFNQPLNNWDVSNVTNMSGMFFKASVFNQPIDKWNVSKVTDMSFMFGQTSFFLQLNNWDVSNVTNMNSMFSYTQFDSPLDKWDVSKVTDMSFMFNTSFFNSPINNWNVSNVTNMEAMFGNACNFNQPLDKWNVSKVENMRAMFQITPFNQPLNNWDVSNVKIMQGMFFRASLFNQPLNNWNVSKVTNMIGLFNRAYNFNQPLDKWDVSNVTNMDVMFNRSYFNQPINNWNVSKVTSMYAMFDRTPFNQPLDKWDVSNVTSMLQMFKNAIIFNQDLSMWSIKNVKTMKEMFTGIALSTDNYSNILIGWANQGPNIQNNVILDGGKSKYNAKAAIARKKLINQYKWQIMDGGLA